MAFVVEVPLNLPVRQQKLVSFSASRRPSNFVTFSRRNQRCLFSISATLNTPVQSVDEKHLARVNAVAIPIMVNSCMGKMGQAIIEAGISAGLHIVPASFGIRRDAGKTVQVGGKDIIVHGPSDRESTLASVLEEYPNLIVADFTVPNAVNENAELYCKTGVPFVMGTTVGDRDILYKTIEDSNLYALISPQMGKQVVAFLEAMEIMSKQFPGAFTGYTLEVNSCTGKMGRAVIEGAIAAGFHVVPVSFGSQQNAGKTVQVGGKDIQVHGPSDRESTLASVLNEYPNLIVVDLTVPEAVNENAELYCKLGVPFVMGTTGGDRDQLYKTVEDSNVYAVIAPNMAKSAVALVAILEFMSKQFPGVFTGFTFEGLESHQHTKPDISATAEDAIKSFQKLGVSFDVDQFQVIRNPKQQVEMVGVPKEYLDGHAYHVFRLTSPDRSIEFQHNVRGRSANTQGAMDVLLFLDKKIRSKADKKIYHMIDVLHAGSMR